MSIKADCHLHSSFSGDSQAPMPEMIDKGLALGLETMCFTEHNDFDYPRTEEGPGTIPKEVEARQRLAGGFVRHIVDYYRDNTPGPCGEP